MIATANQRIPALFTTRIAGTAGDVDLLEHTSIVDWRKAILLDNSPRLVAGFPPVLISPTELATFLVSIPTVIAMRTVFALVTVDRRLVAPYASLCTSLGRAFDALMADSEPVRAIVASYANDPSHVGVLPDTLRILRQRWGEIAAAIVECSVSRHFPPGGTSHIARLLACSRAELARRLRRDGCRSAKHVVDAARGLAISLCVTRGQRSVSALQAVAGVRDHRTIDRIIQRVVGASLSEIQAMGRIGGERMVLDRILPHLDLQVCRAGSRPDTSAALAPYSTQHAV